MGISREPGLQRRRRLDPAGLAQSCSSLLVPPQQAGAEPTAEPHRTAPPAASRSRSAHRSETKPPNPLTQADPGPSAGPRPAADPGPRVGSRPADSGPSAEPGAAGESGQNTSVKPRPSAPDSQPQLSQPQVAAPEAKLPSATERVLRWRAGLRPGGQRSEYHRQFGCRKPTKTPSPLLTADQLLRSFKTNPVSVETEYQRSFQGPAPSAEPRPHHLEHQRVPLFHMHMTNKKRKQESERRPPAPPQVQRGHRTLADVESSFGSPLHRIPEESGAPDGEAAQVRELRQRASLYRQRAWEGSFSRAHLSQLLSEHNGLWEPTDTTDSDPPSPRLTSDLCQDSHGSGSHLEVLHPASRSGDSSRRSSTATQHTHRDSQTTAQRPPRPPEEMRTAWGGGGGGEEEEEEDSEQEEGRLPTPRLKILPVQRTHHDLTTPAAGGAILVGKLKSSDGSSPIKQHRCGSTVSMAAEVETAANEPVRLKEAWSEKNPSPAGSSPNHKPAGSPPSKPIRMKQTPSPHMAPPPQHGIHGTLRHPDFQHNGQLGLRLREPPCAAGGCSSDDDDRLSVMSWRSAASCSAASAILERAQKRRENFWGKR